MDFTSDLSQKRFLRAQFMHLAKEAQIEANKRRPIAISERYLYQGK